MVMPKVSVIIPVYKAEKYISRCIESILNQTLNDIEIILIDDCGGDKSIDIIKSYMAEHANIKLVEHEKNYGPMIARYNGYMSATSDYITFCDSDDTLPCYALETLYYEAIKSSADIVSGLMNYISNDYNITHLIGKNALPYGDDSEGVIKSLFAGELIHNLCAKLFSTKIIQSGVYNNYYNFKMGEDALLFYQICLNVKKVSVLDKVVYYYWQNSESSTQSFKDADTIRNMALSNVYIHQLICKKKPSLNVMADKWLSKQLNIHINSGYGHIIRKIAKEFELERLLSIHYILLNYSYTDCFYLFSRRIKRFVVNFISLIK